MSTPLATPSSSSSATKTIAFALGGLAGNNFHGAGLLEAALQRNIQPTIISCTTGQIYWVYEYLIANNARRVGATTSLTNVIDREFLKLQPKLWPDVNFFNLFIPIFGSGSQEKFRPPFLEWPTNLGSNFLQLFWGIWLETFKAFNHVRKQHKLKQHQPTDLFYLKKFLNIFPVQLLIPKLVLNNNKCQQISNVLNSTTIAIIFNSYDPLAGKERIHLNPAARALLESTRPGRLGSKRPGQPSSSRSYGGAGPTANYYVTGNPAARQPAYGVIREYQGINPNSVRDALWLYEYGFGYNATYLDGAYLRGIILNELATVADTIYVARPINHQWIGPLPKTLLERFDLETEVFFNGSYFGELDRIQLINELLADPAIEPTLSAAGFKVVTIIPIEINVQRGFFDYLFEDMAVFKSACQTAMNVL